MLCYQFKPKTKNIIYIGSYTSRSTYIWQFGTPPKEKFFPLQIVGQLYIFLGG